jgi:hypothetical protein
MGGAFAYILETERPYWHFPVAFVFPSPYAGYHAYRNRAEIRTFLKEMA